MKINYIPLKQASSVIMGQSPESSTYNKEKWGLPFFQGKADFGHRHPIPRKWCSAPIKIAEPNDILLSVRAPVGPTNICNTRSCIGRGLTAIRVKSGYDYQFVWYYLRRIEHKIARLGVGSTFTAIGSQDIAKIKIPTLPIETQLKITSILQKSESAREKRKEAIRLADEFIKSVFLDMFGDPARNPKGWNISSLEEVSYKKGQYGLGASAVIYDKKKPRYIRITDISGDGKLTNDFVSPNINNTECEDCILEDGDILFARSGATVGKTYRYRKKDGFCVFAGYLIRFKPNKEMIHPDYLFYYTKTNAYKKWIEAKQKVVAQPNINAKQYGNELKLPIPPIELQQKFTDIVLEVEKLKEKQRESEKELDTLFNSLMQRAFRGDLFREET